MSRFRQIDLKYSSLEVDGIWIWKLVRKSVYDAMNRTESGFSAIKKKQAKAPLGWVLLTFLRNIRFLRGTYDTVLFENPRKVELDGRIIDPYTDPIFQYLESTDSKWVAICDDSLGVVEPVNSNRYYTKRKYPRVRNDVKRAETIFADPRVKQMISDLRDICSYELTHRFFVGRLVYFLREEGFYFKKLKKWKTSRLILVCSYGKEGMISAIKKLKVQLIEAQHGVIYKGHFGYDFEGWATIPYFPDLIFAFSDEWFKNFAYRNTRIVNIGTILRPKPIQNQIRFDLLYITQWILIELMLDQILAQTKAFPELRIAIKPHPMDDIEYIENRLIGTNVKVLKESLELSLSFTQLVCGVFSTALYEAYSSGKGVVLLRLPGIENMETFIGSTACMVADGYAAFDISTIPQTTNAAGQNDMWFDEVNTAAIKRTLGVQNESC